MKSKPLHNRNDFSVNNDYRPTEYFHNILFYFNNIALPF